MNSATFQAIQLVLIAAVINAVYTLPMKWNKRWDWEHSWLVFTVLGITVVPTVLSALTIPRLTDAYRGIPSSLLLGMALCGMLWGVSLVFFGRAVDTVGVAVTFAVSLGTSAASGALIPLVSQHSAELVTRRGLLILASISIVLVGVGICGIAGRQREMEQTAGAGRAPSRFLRGILLAFLSGILGSMLNSGLALGAPIQRNAQNLGASEAMMSNAVWLPCLYAGAIPGVIYCLLLMRKKGSSARLIGEARWYYWLTPALMGLLWFGSIMCYSLASVKLGDLGPVIAWPLFLSAVVIASTIAGVVTGEWKRSGRRALTWMWAGVVCLVVAMGLLASISV
ncbi:MAG TPA: L-rhamnose/proton symporter RhaT [Bryobacteraceae bacterium]|nr:L-rhamnose/proton symporter RhaT [Bryobacteraceae bacterium]